MRPGDLVLVRSLTPLGWLIRFLTGSEFNHVAVVVDEQEWLEADPRQGVRYVAAYPNSSVYRTHIFRLKSLAPFKAAALLAWLNKRAGARYDVLAAVARLLRWPGWLRNLVNDPNAYFCAELVTDGFVAVKCPLPAWFTDRKPMTLSEMRSAPEFMEIAVPSA